MNTIHTTQSEQTSLEIEIQSWEQLIEITKNRFFEWEQVKKMENWCENSRLFKHTSMIKKDILLQIKMLEEAKTALVKIKKGKTI